MMKMHTGDAWVASEFETMLDAEARTLKPHVRKLFAQCKPHWKAARSVAPFEDIADSLLYDVARCLAQIQSMTMPQMKVALSVANNLSLEILQSASHDAGMQEDQAGPQIDRLTYPTLAAVRATWAAMVALQWLSQITTSEAPSMLQIAEFSKWHAEVQTMILCARMPLARKGRDWTEQQRKFALDRHKEDQAKHERWRKLQRQEAAIDPAFAVKSKSAQARSLKRKHAIDEGVQAISKQLEPLPSTRRKK